MFFSVAIYDKIDVDYFVREIVCQITQPRLDKTAYRNLQSSNTEDRPN